MKTYMVRTTEGIRCWQADDAAHAADQHNDAFAEEAVLEVRELVEGDRVAAVRFAVDRQGTTDADGLIRDSGGAVVSVDDNVTVPPGTQGTVESVDDAGVVHVRWDNGRYVGLLPGVDQWTVLG